MIEIEEIVPVTSFSISGWVRKGIDAIQRILKGRGSDPGDPYAMVTAPVQPRLPTRSARAAAEPER